MNAKKMMRLCITATYQLNDLEAVLSSIPAEYEADRFVYTSLTQVRELHQIAEYETAGNMTREQTAHIRQVLMDIQRFIDIVPDDPRKQHEDE